MAAKQSRHRLPPLRRCALVCCRTHGVLLGTGQGLPIRPKRREGTRPRGFGLGIDPTTNHQTEQVRALSCPPQGAGRPLSGPTKATATGYRQGPRAGSWEAARRPFAPRAGGYGRSGSSGGLGVCGSLKPWWLMTIRLWQGWKRLYLTLFTNRPRLAGVQLRSRRTSGNGSIPKPGNCGSGCAAGGYRAHIVRL